MARGSKAPKSRLEKATWLRFSVDINEKKSKLDTASMEHAGVWKKADPLNIHAGAAKFILRLSKMEDSKRMDFWRSVKVLVGFMGWEDQMDMLEKVLEVGESLPMAIGQVNEVEVIAEDDTAAREALNPRICGDVQEEAPIHEVAKASLDDEEFDKAGHVFTAGQEAGMSGTEADANPYAEGTPSNPVWENGRIKGAKQRAAAAEGPIVEERPKSVMQFFGGDEDGEDPPAVVAAQEAAKPRRGRPPKVKADERELDTVH